MMLHIFHPVVWEAECTGIFTHNCHVLPSQSCESLACHFQERRRQVNKVDLGEKGLDWHEGVHGFDIVTVDWLKVAFDSLRPGHTLCLHRSVYIVRGRYTQNLDLLTSTQTRPPALGSFLATLCFNCAASNPSMSSLPRSKRVRVASYTAA